MRPTERPIPRFIADTTQEGIPHGRFAERLRGELTTTLEAIEDLPGGAELPPEVEWFPERSWGGRVWVPFSARSESEEGRLELFGHVSYVQSPDGEPHDFDGNQGEQPAHRQAIALARNSTFFVQICAERRQAFCFPRFGERQQGLGRDRL